MEYVKWVRKDNLARASRPAYRSTNVTLADMERWMRQVQAMQIRSIICLLDGEQLAYYQQIPGGLLEYYRQQEFEVVNIPVKDPAHNDVGNAELEASLDQVYAQYQRLPKPVLIHCSAGVHRTGRVVEDILARDQP